MTEKLVGNNGLVAEVIAGYFAGEKGLRVFIGPTDPISDMPVFILAEHHHMHEGEMHQVTYPPAALANGASIDFRLVVGNLTPTSRTPHITIELDTTGESWMYLYETPTTTANGTQLTARNKKQKQRHRAKSDSMAGADCDRGRHDAFSLDFWIWREIRRADT